MGIYFGINRAVNPCQLAKSRSFKIYIIIHLSRQLAKSRSLSLVWFKHILFITRHDKKDRAEQKAVFSPFHKFEFPMSNQCQTLQVGMSYQDTSGD